MKKSILMVVTILMVSTTFAQSDKYLNAMKQNISQSDSIMAKGNAVELANNFVRIGDAEKDKWLPYYYAAYSTISQAFSEQDNSKKDAIADKASDYLTKAESILGKDNSEINVIKSMISTAHMMVDPQSRFMSYGAKATEYARKAEMQDSTNPRPVLLVAQNTFYTPEAFGGGKDAAKPMFEKAKELYESFKPETELSPVWGKQNVAYFLAQYK
ncbi:MAG: hypothetical protein ABIW47_15240 [Ginsengibacter sp.]|jgi:hypothetical protein